jgi:hypothetical protein
VVAIQHYTDDSGFRGFLRGIEVGQSTGFDVVVSERGGGRNGLGVDNDHAHVHLESVKGEVADRAPLVLANCQTHHSPAENL